MGHADPENLDIGTIRGGNFYHTFLESGHHGLLENRSWTCQRGSLIGDPVTIYLQQTFYVTIQLGTITQSLSDNFSVSKVYIKLQNSA